MAKQSIVVSVLADTKGLSSGLSKASGMMGKLGGAAGALVKGIAGVTGAVAGLAIGGGIARALNIDEATTKLKALGYEGQALQGIMDSALASVKGTSYGLGDAATLATQALAAGIPQGKALTDSLTLVTNTAALAGSSLGDMGSIFAKVWTAGRVGTEELNQLADRGIPIWTTLADSLGVGVSELRTMVSAGQVTADMFESALGPAVEGVAGTMGTSFKGLAQNLMAALSRVGAIFAGPAIAAAKPWMDFLIGGLDSIATKLAPLGERFGAFLAGVSPPDGFSGFLDTVLALAGPLIELAGYFSPIGIAVKALGPILPTLADAFGNLAATLGGALGQVLPVVAGLFAQIMAAAVPLLGPIGELAAQIATALVPVIEAVVPVVALLADALVQLLPAVLPIVTALVALLVPILSLIEPLTELALAVLPVVIDALTTLAGFVQGVVMTALKALEPVIQSIVTALGGLIDFVTGVFTGDWEKAWQGIQDLFGGIWDAIVGLLTGVVQVIASIVMGAVEGWLSLIEDWGTNIFDAVSGAWDSIINWLRGIGSKIAAIFIGAAVWLVSAGRNILRGLNDGIRRGWDTVSAWFRAVPDNIGRFFGGVGGWLVGMGRDLVRGFGQGIRNMGQWLIDQIGGVVDGAIGWAKSLLGINSPSRVFRQIGTYTIQGLAQGLKDTRPVRAAMNGLSGLMEDSLSYPGAVNAPRYASDVRPHAMQSGTPAVQVVELSAHDRALLAAAGDVRLSIDGKDVAHATNGANFVAGRRGSN